MRDIRFKNFAATGPREASWAHATLAEFLLISPLFAYELKAFGVIPPLHIFNEKLSKGSYDAGMGGGSEWEPFELSKEEYKELVENLVTNPDYDISEDRELWEKPNYKKWHGALLSKYSKKIRGKS